MFESTHVPVLCLTWFSYWRWSEHFPILLGWHKRGNVAAASMRNRADLNPGTQAMKNDLGLGRQTDDTCLAGISTKFATRVPITNKKQQQDKKHPSTTGTQPVGSSQHHSSPPAHVLLSLPRHLWRKWGFMTPDAGESGLHKIEPITTTPDVLQFIGTSAKAQGRPDTSRGVTDCRVATRAYACTRFDRVNC